MAKTPEELLGSKQLATEETLQSIDGTLKRILELLEKRENREMAFHTPLNLHLHPATGRGDENERNIENTTHYSD